jgi:PIN domain nuclease of toxin-antitoxin system
LGYLLDSNMILFALYASQKIKPRIRALLSDKSNRICTSVASIYEISFKANLGKLWLPDGFDIKAHLIASDTELLSINPVHAAVASQLPTVIRDPWDRVIAAQAISEHLTLISSDNKIGALGVKTTW